MPPPSSQVSLHKFYFDAIVSAKLRSWRYGQALFNKLLELRPELAEKVRATNMDVFHMQGPADDFERWDRFISFVETNWYPGDSQ